MRLFAYPWLPQPSMDDEASSVLLKIGALTRDPASRLVVTSSGAKRLFTTNHSVIKRGCGDVVVVGASRGFCLAARRSPHPTIVDLPPSRRAIKFDPVVLVAISDESRYWPSRVKSKMTTAYCW